jgi:hypothetical protein
VTTFVKGHFRGAKYHPAYIAKTTELLPYDLGAILERELDKALDEEWLDELDMDEAQRQRIKETW